MIYVAKFIALWLLPPGIIIICLLGMGLRLYRMNKRISLCSMFLALLVYALSTTAVADMLLRPLEYAYKPAAHSVDAIVVLGGGMTQNTTDVSGKGNLGPYSANRLLTAVQLQRQLGVPIIFSGGQVFSNGGNEAEVADRVLRNLGVEPSKIILDSEARNTAENAFYTAKIAKKHHFKNIYLVTSAFHMPRSMKNFERQMQDNKITVVPYPCDYLTPPDNSLAFFSWCPQFNGLEKSFLALHEYLGLLAVYIL